MKSENYTNFGGINVKSDTYSTGPMEFLDIINMDFQSPGALTQRAGSTQYVSQNFSAPITGLFEYSRLNGASYVVVGASGALWAGATTGQSQGISLINQSATFTALAYFTNISTTPINGTPITVAEGLYYQGNANLLVNAAQGGFVLEGTTFCVNSKAFSSNNFSFAVFQDYLFVADGNVFLKYNGSTVSPVGLPPATQGFGITSSWTSSATTVVGIGVGTSTVLGFYASYVNRRGFEGPIWPLGTIDYGNLNAASFISFGGTYAVIQYGINTPSQWDIASINLYGIAGQSIAISHQYGTANFWNLPYTFVSNTPASGSTVTYVNAGAPAGTGQTTLFGNLGNFPTNPGYQPLGLTLVSGTGATTGIVTEIDIVNYAPQFIDVYKNQLFLAGFSSTPSTVWFSDIGEPEGYLPDSNFEVRTNDGDVITCIKSYSTRFYIFKKNSFHVLYGDNPLNFNLVEASLVYGCLNNRCAVIYNDVLAFLDRKGVVLFNGASPTMLSDKMQPIFDSMNYNVALQTACMAHDKLRNQILVAIPINGATQNNVTLVYDYLVGAWTKQDGYNPTLFATIQGRNSTKNLFYGTSNGLVNWFGSSFLSDNGAGFTAYFKSRFLHDVGESYQKQFRRLYLNIDPPSATLTFKVNFFQDFGASIVKGVTVNASQFQTRIDYGISAKSIAFEFSSLQTNSVLKLHGFTIESRLQRKV